MAFPVHRSSTLVELRGSAVNGRGARTVTRNAQRLKFPLASAASHYTRVSPTANTLPLGGEHRIRGCGVQSSVAVTS
jgi:hypothetical protein